MNFPKNNISIVVSKCSVCLCYIILLLIIFQMLCLCVRQWNIYKCVRLLPGPRNTMPIFGNSHLFFNCNTTDIYNTFIKLIERYGKRSAFKFWIGNKVFVILTKPEDLRVLYNSKYAMEKEQSVYKFFSKWLGSDSLLIAPVEKWKSHRRILAMTFSQKVLDRYVEIFSKNGSILVKELEKYANINQTFDAYSVINKYSVKSICGTLMGVDLQNEGLIQQYLYAVQKEAEIIYLKMCKFWLNFKLIYIFTKMYEEEMNCLKILHDFSQTIFRTKHLSYSTVDAFENQIKFGINPKRKPFLELMIDLKSKSVEYDEKQILDDMNIFLAAGSETTAITSSFILLMLGIHQDIQHKVYVELNKIFTKRNRQQLNTTDKEDITPDDIRQMVYLEMVIKETLRLYPIVPIVARRITNDLMLPTSGTIPAGCCCIAAPIAVHYDPDVWSRPLLFNPDRFQCEEKIKRHVYSFIPFSGGLRNCIGKKFAFMSLKVLIASIVRDYQILTDIKMADIKLKVEVTLKSVNGYPIKLVRRDDM